MLAMDPHMTKYQEVGNVCRYALFLNGMLKKETLTERIREKKIFDWLCKLRIRKNFPFSLPGWELANEQHEIGVFTNQSETAVIPDEIFKQNISIGTTALFQFDLIYHPINKTILVFSWHHILMDGRGAGMLLKYLNNDNELENAFLIPGKKNNLSLVTSWNNMMDSKNFLNASSRKPLASLIPEVDQIKNATSHFSIIRFDEHETARINANAISHGARLGNSPYYLAAATRSVHQILKKRGNAALPFWIPVPQDERLRGSKGPLITNQLSFIFYRIPAESLISMKAAVNEIASQMVDQIRQQVPKKYASMMDWLRRLPLKPYYQLIKAPGGGSLASFLFSVAADSPGESKPYFDLETEDAINYPPNTYPPGLTVVFMRFHGTIKIIIARAEEAVSQDEINLFGQLIRKDLLEGDSLT